MTDSSAQVGAQGAEIPEGRPVWPYPDIAPGVGWHKHRSQWYKTKTRGGKTRFLWLGRDPMTALRRYRQKWDAFQRGETVLIDAPEEGRITLRYIFNEYLEALDNRVRRGDIGKAHYHQYEKYTIEISRFLGADRDVASFTPRDFESLMRSWEKLAPSSVKKRVDLIGTVFRWAEKNIPTFKRPFVGTEFRAPPKRIIRRARNAKRGEVFTPEQVHKMLALADELMRPAILLAVNMGAGSADMAAFKRFEINLTKGVFDGSRHKTEAARFATLWPETIEALGAYARPAPASAEYKDLFFLNARGWPVASGVNNSTIHDRFNKFIRKPLKLPYGFYTLKSTFVSFADQLGDERAKKLITGHVDDDILGHYSRRVIETRVRSITDFVREEMGFAD